MNYSIIILAAGQGTRMKSETPKVLHKLCGKPMIHHIIKESKKLTDDITVVLYHKKEMVEDYINKNFENINIVIQDHENYPGTGGAVMGIEPKKRRVVVLNGDMPLVTKAEIKKLGESDSDIALTTIELKDPDGYGRVIVDNEKVSKIVEQKDASEEEKRITLVNAGVYSFNTKFMLDALKRIDNNNNQKEYYITDLISLGVADKKSVVSILGEEDKFSGVNSKVQLAQLEEIMSERINQEHMKNGVIIRLPKTVMIEEGVEFIGECEVESGCVIKGDSVIENSTIFANSIVEDGEIRNSTVGPMARIRPKSKLINSHIGNFVETKKSTLNGVKAGHLSYLGDAEIDEGTNVGAGTITCNYDGKGKYKTKIGKNVFIGSDTQLVAPVTLNDNTMVAAGTTVTSDVEEGALVLSRTKQKTISGFFKKFFNDK